MIYTLYKENKNAIFTLTEEEAKEFQIKLEECYDILLPSTIMVIEHDLKHLKAERFTSIDVFKDTFYLGEKINLLSDIKCSIGTLSSEGWFSIDFNSFVLFMITLENRVNIKNLQIHSMLLEALNEIRLLR